MLTVASDSSVRLIVTLSMLIGTIDFSLKLVTRLEILTLQMFGLGHRTVLTSDQVAQLVSLELESNLFGRTVADLRRLVFSFCEANHIPHPFNTETKMAGEDWARSFLKRNPTLSVRKPEGTSIFRAAGFNRENVNDFYDLLEGVLFHNRIQTVPDENVFNVDESGYTICQKPQKIVAKKGKRAVGTLLSAEKGKIFTAV